MGESKANQEWVSQNVQPLAGQFALVTGEVRGLGRAMACGKLRWRAKWNTFHCKSVLSLLDDHDERTIQLERSIAALV
jgi:hypothetical protein